MTSVILIFRNNIERRKKAKNVLTQSGKWTEYQHGHNRGTVTSVSDRPENANMSADTSYVDDTSGQPVSCTFGRRSHGLLKAGGRQLLFWFRFLRNHGNFKDSLKFQSHKHKDNAHNVNRRYFHKYWTRHFDLMGERKGDVWCSWECKNISGNVPLVGGASSFLGTTTFFSGTFFLTSGTLKTPFHDKNVFWRARKKARSLYTQKDHHATFTQKRDRMQAATPQEMTEIFRERN